MQKYTLRTNTRYKIKTPSGYQSFGGVRKLKKESHYKIWLSNGKVLKCSLTHKFISNEIEISADKLQIGDEIDSESNESVSILNIIYLNRNIQLYDIVEVGNGNIFNVDGIVSHNCDFISSGNQVIDAEILQFYKETHCQPPLEKTGIDGNLWKWEYPDYNKSYMVIADVARGDSTDYSACHVIDVENAVQVAEYVGKLGTRDFGNFLVSLSTEYNEALLVIENANVGWAVIQQVIDRNYGNLFYMSKDLKYVDTERQMTNRYYAEERNMVAGFSTTSRTRPLIISKLDMYFKEQSITIRSTRLIEQLMVFIWNGSKAEAMRGYNDDLVMAMSIGLWVRDTALRLRQEGVDLTKRALGGITQQNEPIGFFSGTGQEDDPWTMKVGGKDEDLKWLLGGHPNKKG